MMNGLIDNYGVDVKLVETDRYFLNFFITSELDDEP